MVRLQSSTPLLYKAPSVKPTASAVHPALVPALLCSFRCSFTHPVNTNCKPASLGFLYSGLSTLQNQCPDCLREGAPSLSLCPCDPGGIQRLAYLLQWVGWGWGIVLDWQIKLQSTLSNRDCLGHVHISREGL